MRAGADAGHLSLRKLFLVTIVLKIASSAAAFWLGSPWLLGFVFPVTLMAVYIGLGLRHGGGELSDEKFADSCYYLGFIFTISSILVSLFDVPQIGTKLSEIAVRFGAALTTTVLGLIVRVYLINFRPEFSDGMRAAESSLLDGVRAFRVHLDLSVDKLNEFQAQVAEASRLAAAQSTVVIRDAAEVQARQSNELFERVAADYRHHFEEATVHLRAATQTLSAALYDYAQNLAAGADQFESHAERFVSGLEARVQAVSLPEDYFAGRLDPAIAGLGRAVTAAGDEVAGSARRLREQVGAIAADLALVGDRAAATMAALDRVRDTVEGRTELLAAAQEQTRVLQNLTAALGKTETAVSRSLASIGGMDQAVRQVVEEAGRVAEFNREAGLLVQRQTDLLAGLQRTLAETLPRLQESDRQTAARLETLSERVERSEALMTAALERQEAVLAEFSEGSAASLGGEGGRAAVVVPGDVLAAAHSRRTE